MVDTRPDDDTTPRTRPGICGAAGRRLLLAAALGLAGCASTGGGGGSPGPMGKAMQALGLKSSASQQNAAAQTTEQHVPLRLYTGSNLNAGASDHPLALVVKIYYLRSPQRFQQVPFDDFVDSGKDQSALGEDLIDSREMLVLPNQRYNSVENMPGDTRYLGVVALFRAPAAQRWRFTYEVKKSMASGITLGLHACALSSTAGALITELPDSADSLAAVHCPKLPQ